MTTIISPNQKETLNNCHQQSDVDVRTAQKASSNFAYLQNEGLSSIGLDFSQKVDTSLSRLHCNDHDDIEAQIKGESKIVTIPDDLLKKIADDFLSKGHLDSPGEMGHNRI